MKRHWAVQSMNRFILPTFLVAFVLGVGHVPASGAPEELTAIVLAMGDGTQIRHHGTESLVNVGSGAELFRGDALQTGGAGVTLLTCTAAPDRKAVKATFPAGRLIEFNDNSWKNAAIQTEDSGVSCALPVDDRFATSNIDDERLRTFSHAGWQDRFNQLTPARQDSYLRATKTASTILGTDPFDLAALLVRVAELERAGLLADAVLDYRIIIEKYPDAAWARRQMIGLMARTLPSAQPDLPQPARPATSARSITGTSQPSPATLSVQARSDSPPAPLRTTVVSPRGPLYALVVGIGNYPPHVGVHNLKYAANDARAFAQFLESGRAGKVGKIDVLDGSKGAVSAAAIREALAVLIAGHEGPDNSLVLFLAAHGFYGCVDKATGKPFPPPCRIHETEPFLLTADTSAEGARMTGLPMRELRQIISDNTYRFGRVVMYIDVCHAGAIEHSPYKDAPPEDAGMEPDVGVWGLMAASKRAEKDKAEEYAYEADVLQHGIFTYYVLSGLAGDAPKTENMILFGTLEELVAAQVKAITSNIQEPKGFSSSPMAVVDDASAHFDFPRVDLKPPLQITGQRSVKRNRSASPLPVQMTNVADDNHSASGFEALLVPNKLLTDQDSAAAAFERMPANERNRFRSRFRRALEDAGQLVLLRYLQGDQVPQIQGDFEHGARLFAQSWQLTDRMNAFDEARMLFCKGRALIFEKRYIEAAQLLQNSIRLEPSRAYAYNALGIAYLEQIPEHPKLLAQAIAAFHDAQTMEPYWAYPLHNLALAYAQQGNNDQAIEAYDAAMRIAPAYSYLPYNLGLLYERLNQMDLAEKNFYLAVKRAEMRAKRLSVSSENWVERAAPLNALSTLYLNEGRTRLAAKQLDAALTADPTYVPALHNKGIMLVARGRRQEAILQWRHALALDSEYLPSRISLAEALAAAHDFDHAALEYWELLTRKPHYVAARRALAVVLVSMNRLEEAREELNRALADNPSFLEAAVERDDVVGILANRAPKSETIKKALAARGGY